MLSNEWIILKLGKETVEVKRNALGNWNIIRKAGDIGRYRNPGFSMVDGLQVGELRVLRMKRSAAKDGGDFGSIVVSRQQVRVRIVIVRHCSLDGFSIE